jgi:hypothetical protein
LLLEIVSLKGGMLGFQPFVLAFRARRKVSLAGVRLVHHGPRTDGGYSGCWAGAVEALRFL